MAKFYGLDATGDKANVQRGDLPRFFPSDLLPFENNYRFGSSDTDPQVKAAREDEIESMVASLCTFGQKQPIIVHPVPGNRFRVHAGDTRHQAFLRIEQRGIWPFAKPGDNGRPRIECIVEESGDDKRTFSTSLTENLTRNNLTVVDIANAVSMATDNYRYTDAEILREFKQLKPDGTAKDPAWLPNMRRLGRLPLKIKRQIHLNHMAASVGYLLAEIPEEYHEEVLSEAAETAPTERAMAASVSMQTPASAPAQSPKPKKVTARRVARVAKSKGLLKHRKVSHTTAGMREFWQPLAEDRKDSLLGRLAAASVKWIDTADDDYFFKSVMSVLKGVK